MGDANTAVHSNARHPSPQSDLSILSHITGPEAVSSIDASLAPSSTPDTSQADTSSVHSDAPKANEQSATHRRQSTRTRAAVATYNDKELAGTRLHTPRKYLKGLATSANQRTRTEAQPPPTTAAEVESHHDGVQLVDDPVDNNAAKVALAETDVVQIVTVGNDAQEEPAEPAPQSEEPEPAALRRASSRRRSNVVTYNDKENAGTRIHTPTKYIDGTYIRKSLADDSSGQTPLAGSDLVRRQSTTSRPQSSLRKSFTADQLNQEVVNDLLTKKSPASGQRNLKRVVDRGIQAKSSSLTPSKRNLNERPGKPRDYHSDSTFAKAKPAVKKSPAKRTLSAKRPVKRQRIVELSPETEPEPETARITEIKSGPLRKPWLNAGKFYNTGQDDFVGRLSAVIGHKPKKAAEVDHETEQSGLFPMPMFSMAEKLDLYPKKNLPEHKRPFEPFQLPFDTFSPLPQEVKVKDWRDLRRNEYKGEDANETRARAKEQSKKARMMEASKCACKGKCDRDHCFNAVLFFECDDNSCNVGRHCGNRQFDDLRERQQDDSHGYWYNKYQIGVEVVETPNRGHGVRAMRTFNRDQIVIEYIGEIITQQESDRRVREVYKDHKCFYLMNFYDKLIIDGFRGNIARFVNHSCNPNCRMEKWTVNGEVRMALFADRYIMTGEELTWHYNFESYGKEQPCYCGSVNCAGVIGRQVRNKPVKKIQEAPSGNKRKYARSPVKPNKKPKLTTIAAAASSTVKNIYSKTKSSVGGLLGTAEDTAATLKKAQEKDGRAERAARRSLAIQEAEEEEDEEDDEGDEEDEDDEDSEDDMRTTRARAARQTSTASPRRKSPAKRTVTKSTTRVIELSGSSSRSSSRRSSTRVSRTQKTRKSVDALPQTMNLNTDSSDLSDAPDSAPEDSTPEDSTPEESTPAPAPKPSISKGPTALLPQTSSLRKSNSFSSASLLANGSTGLRQTTLALFGNAFKWKMETPKTEPVKKGVNKKLSLQDLASTSSGKKGGKRNT